MTARRWINASLRLAGLALVLGLALFAGSPQVESSDHCIQQYNSCISGCPIGGSAGVACEASCQQSYSNCSGDGSTPPNTGIQPGTGYGEPGCTCSLTCLRIDCIP